MSADNGKPREVRWTWASRDSNLRTGYMAVDGRVSIADLIAHMAEVAPGVDLADIAVNWATVVWHRQATAEEIADRRQAEERWEARHESCERKTLARLTAKYGAPGPMARLPARLAEGTNP